MKLIITGATGFLGGRVARQAVRLGHEVVALCRPGRRPLDEDFHHGIHWVEGALSEVRADCWDGCEALLHFAAAGVSPQQTDWDEAFRVNVWESVALVAGAVAAGVSRIIASGSCVEYGLTANQYEKIPADAALRPCGAYAASKAAFSGALLAMAREGRADFTLVRPFHLFGEGQHEANIWPALKRAALAGEDFPMSPGGQMRDYFCVDEAANAFIGLLGVSSRHGGLRVRNLASGVSVSLEAFACHWWHHWNASGELQVGRLPYRSGELMRLVPDLQEVFL